MPPATPYAKLQVRINGGAPVSGRIEVNVGDVLVFSAESLVGWPSNVAPAYYELSCYGICNELPLPTDWVSEVVDGRTVYRYYGAGPTAPVTLSVWGKFLPALVINGGSGPRPDPRTGIDPLMIDRSTGITVESDLGFRDIALGEGSQFGGPDRWVPDLRENIKRTQEIAEDLYGGAGGSSAGTPEATPDTVMRRAPVDARVDAGYVRCGGTPSATAGCFRGPNATALVVARNQGDTGNMTCVTTTTTAVVVGPAAAEGVGLSLRTATSQVMSFLVGATQQLSLAANLLTLASGLLLRMGVVEPTVAGDVGMSSIGRLRLWVDGFARSVGLVDDPIFTTLIPDVVDPPSVGPLLVQAVSAFVRVDATLPVEVTIRPVRAGDTVIIKEAMGGSSPITVYPYGSNTIDGLGAGDPYVFVGAFSVARFYYDGVKYHVW